MLTIWTDIERRSEWRFFSQRWSQHPDKKYIFQLYKDVCYYEESRTPIKTRWSMLAWLVASKDDMPHVFWNHCVQLYRSAVEYKNIDNMQDWYIQSFFVSEDINLEQLSTLNFTHIEGFTPYELGWICSYVLLVWQKRHERMLSHSFWYESVALPEQTLKLNHAAPDLWPYIPEHKKKIWHKHWQFFSKKEVLMLLREDALWIPETELPNTLNDWLQHFNENEVNIYV